MLTSIFFNFSLTRILTLTCIFTFYFYFPTFYSLSSTSNLMPACIFNFYLLCLSFAHPNSNSTQTCLLLATFLASSICMSCSCQTNPNANRIIITWLVLHLHLTSFNCMCQHAVILALYFLLHLCVSTLSSSSRPKRPSLTCFSFSLSCLFSLIVPLSPYIMFLCPALSLRTLCCTFLNTFCLAMHLQLVDHNLKSTSLPPSIAVCSFLLHLWILYLSICLAPQILCLWIICLAAWPWHVLSLPKYLTSQMHLPVTPYTFVESNIMNSCPASLSNPTSCTFDSHLWLTHFWILCLVLCLCLAFVLHFLVHHFLASLRLALLTLITCITSLASLPYSWISLCCTLSFSVYHNLAPLNPLSITCRAPLSWIFGLLYLAQSYAIVSMVILYFRLA